MPEASVPTATLHVCIFIFVTLALEDRRPASCSGSQLLVWEPGLSLGPQCSTEDRITADVYYTAPLNKVTFIISRALRPFHVASELEKAVRTGTTVPRL